MAFYSCDSGFLCRKVIIQCGIFYSSLALESREGGRWGDFSGTAPGVITLTIDLVNETVTQSGGSDLNRFLTESVYDNSGLRIHAYHGVRLSILSVTFE